MSIKLGWPGSDSQQRAAPFGACIPIDSLKRGDEGDLLIQKIHGLRAGTDRERRRQGLSAAPPAGALSNTHTILVVRVKGKSCFWAGVFLASRIDLSGRCDRGSIHIKSNLPQA